MRSHWILCVVSVCVFFGASQKFTCTNKRICVGSERLRHREHLFTDFDWATMPVDRIKLDRDINYSEHKMSRVDWLTTMMCMNEYSMGRRTDFYSVVSPFPPHKVLIEDCSKFQQRTISCIQTSMVFVVNFCLQRIIK